MPGCAKLTLQHTFSAEGTTVWHTRHKRQPCEKSSYTFPGDCPYDDDDGHGDGPIFLHLHELHVCFPRLTRIATELLQNYCSFVKKKT